MTINPTYKHSELTDVVIKTFYEVYNELGYGFAEVVYRNSLQIALIERGLEAKAEVHIPVMFHGANVGDFKPDLIVNNCLILELKAADAIVRTRGPASKLLACMFHRDRPDSELWPKTRAEKARI